ncbi:MAG: Phosphatidylinositol 4-kinase pik1alpha (PI4-kinase)(PtdIns-4-kinase) [Vezdaea aestivalis]|nr:MAG: Phosphatidylinositol 4-kinase pik1alpha (PI4-kinase)(PtdIns-4-kinase) [Vezdaea aestivalis]
MSWALLKRLIESEHFNKDPFLPVSYLSRYAEHVGIHYVLCQKLRQFIYEEIEFFLPQLCHLIISVDNESMALEEFIVDLCEESVNAALLTFWLFQTYLHDLSAQPQSKAFRTCRRVYNKVQHIVFGVTEPSRREKIRDNVLPVSVLASFVLAGVAAPFLPRWAGPIAIGQAKKPRSFDDTISDVSQVQKISRSHTVAGGSTRTRREKGLRSGSGPLTSNHNKPIRPKEGKVGVGKQTPSLRTASNRPSSRGNSSHIRPALVGLNSSEARVSTVSLPDMGNPSTTSGPSTPAMASGSLRPLSTNPNRYSHNARTLTPLALNSAQKIKLLRSHYFRSETLFLNALEDISNRLIVVPKAARLSALRAELALIAQDLPAEVDVPVICPADLRNGSPSRSVHHRIIRLNPAEATVLNSAEKVPYLLMVEVLRGDFDFDPDADANVTLLAKLLGGASSKRIFDLSENSHTSYRQGSLQSSNDSVFEPVQGDLGSSPLLRSGALDPDETPRPSVDPSISPNPVVPRLSSGANTVSTGSTLTTPRTSDMSGRSASPGPQTSIPPHKIVRSATIDQPDVSALATHMRTAAHMLTQLDASGSRRPREEVAAIKAKIIASMQTLEEQSFYTEEQPNGPTFAAIMASTNDPRLMQEPDTLEQVDDAPTDPGSATSAGADRMENDQKTGGVQRKGDRDDPSAATFGEDWEAKRQRIRKSSPYGWMKNWDLLSVIVKTGADLRQEAFACQLIQMCNKSWQNAGVPVWVKKMRILVTGESSGLIETITNGVSLHSLKRSLTLATIAAGTNPRGRIATLKDHFVKAFGEPESPAYTVAEDAFVRSLAAYSIISYVLQLKDRHNGNILIDSEGHIIHIDFGFMLSNSPGSVGFEAAPFKLTQDYVDVLGGVDSKSFGKFKVLCKEAFKGLP